jgi:hypothetical protein
MACVISARGDEDVKKKAEFKWARGVADEFLKAVNKRDGANVEALLVPEYAKLLKDRTFGNPEPADAVYDRIGSIDKWTITGEDISPDQDEAVFKGVVESKRGTRAFTLRVAKVKDAGRWRVCLLSVEEEKPHPNPEPKK